MPKNMTWSKTRLHPLKCCVDNLNLKFYSIKLQLLAVLSNKNWGKLPRHTFTGRGHPNWFTPQGGIRIILDAGPEIRSVLGG